KRSSASQSVSLRTTTAACEPTTARSSLASSLMAATVCANPSAKPVDLWTTRRRVAHRVHRHNNSSRPEQTEKCVTHVPGQNCYPCPRLLRAKRGGWGQRKPHPVGLRPTTLPLRGRD